MGGELHKFYITHKRASFIPSALTELSFSIYISINPVEMYKLSFLPPKNPIKDKYKVVS